MRERNREEMVGEKGTSNFRDHHLEKQHERRSPGVIVAGLRAIVTNLFNYCFVDDFWHEEADLPNRACQGELFWTR